LFTESKLNKDKIKTALKKIPFQQKLIFEDYNQLYGIGME
jgi:hypothetical protein